jgi:rubrerythrin
MTTEKKAAAEKTDKPKPVWVCMKCKKDVGDKAPAKCPHCKGKAFEPKLPEDDKKQMPAGDDAKKPDKPKAPWACSNCGEVHGLTVPAKCVKCGKTDFARVDPKAKPKAKAKKDDDTLPQTKDEMMSKTLDELSTVAKKTNDAMADHDRKKSSAKIAKDYLEAMQEKEHNLVMRLDSIRDGSYMPLFQKPAGDSKKKPAAKRIDFTCSDKKCGQTWSGGPKDDTCPKCKQAAKPVDKAPPIDDDNLMAAKRHFEGRAKKGQGGTVLTVALYVFSSRKKPETESAQRLCDELVKGGDIEAAVEDGKTTYTLIDKDAKIK